MANKLVIPPVSADEDGWEAYQSPIQVSPDLEAGQDSPEGAVVHFYAAMMRGDRAAAESVLENPSSERTQAKMDKLAGWTFDSVALTAKKMKGVHKGYVRLAFEVTIDGDSDGGEDDVTVRNREGKWTLQRPPT